MIILEGVLRARDELVARCRNKGDDYGLRVLSRVGGRHEGMRSILWNEYEHPDGFRGERNNCWRVDECSAIGR